MKTDNLILAVAIVAVVVSIVGAGLTFNYIDSFKSKLTGLATTATINLSVESSTLVNFSTANINWGSGRVDSGYSLAVLNTANGSSNVTQGNWTGNTAGLILENLGNSNLTLNLSFGKDADSLLGGTSPSYEYNVSNNEAGSCLNATDGTDGLNTGVFVSANTTTRTVCNSFKFAADKDSVRIDIKLVIPEDSKTGAIGDTITSTVVSS